MSLSLHLSAVGISYPGWVGLDIPAIIGTTASASAASNPVSLAPGPPGVRVSSLKGLHLRFVCRVATDLEVPPMWVKVTVSHSKQEGLEILSQYLFTGMESFRHDFHSHTQLLHMGGWWIYNFVVGDRFCEPGEKPGLPRCSWCGPGCRGDSKFERPLPPPMRTCRH